MAQSFYEEDWKSVWEKTLNYKFWEAKSINKHNVQHVFENLLVQYANKKIKLLYFGVVKLIKGEFLKQAGQNLFIQPENPETDVVELLDI